MPSSVLDTGDNFVKKNTLPSVCSSERLKRPASQMPKDVTENIKKKGTI